MTSNKQKRSAKTGRLNKEDALLWKQVADSTTPLTAKRGQFLQEEMEKLLRATASSSPPVKQPKHEVFSPPKTNPPPQPARPKSLDPNPLEKSLLRKLGRKTKSVDARIDLHGMTLDRARFALLDFFQMAQQDGSRIVLVITGKGNEGRGVLKENVPRWLSLPAFARYVNGYEQAHGHQGGEGALYVRIRRPIKGRF